MSVVKVNPKLIATCRLCLEDIGQYVIVPRVQEQIKYCFDIHVEPFDGLPQVLCNKCGGILKEFYEIKKKFVDKQNDFINKIQVEKTQKQSPEETNVVKPENCPSEAPKSAVNNSKKIVLSFSCSRLDQPSQYTTTQNKKDTKKSMSWLSDYKKQYVCRLCGYHGKKKYNIFKHTNTCHKNLKTKHQNILKYNCKIKLDKLDKLPNLTGQNDTVVISNEKIVQDIDNNYCIIYTSKNLKNDSSDSSDDDNRVRKKQKTSEDKSKQKKEECQEVGVVKDDTKEVLNGDCINIDDSSDSAPEENTNIILPDYNSNNAAILQKLKITDTIQDHSSKIQSIISMCHNKYQKNIDLHKMHNKQPNNLALSKSQLKHKVLSIGRKIINKQGFNCTGLLRYMEHRNLEIVWTPNISNYNTDSNYVRIMTKLNANVVDEDDIGWKTCKLKRKVNYAAQTTSDEPPMPKISQVFYSDRNINSTVDTKNKLLNKTPVANPKQMPRKSFVIEKHNNLIPATVTPTSLDNNISKNKELLDSAYSMPSLDPTTVISLHQSCNNEKNTNTEHKENNSLTPQNVIQNDKELTAGRIKVKPLAELLSKEGLMNTFSIGTPTNPTPLNQSLQPKMFNCMVKENDCVQISSKMSEHNYVGLVIQTNPAVVNIQPSQIVQTNNTAQTTVAMVPPVPPKNMNLTVSTDQTNQSIQIDQQSQVQSNTKSAAQLQTSTPLTNNEFVIMDTVELPSTKTNSPIQYLEKLLLIHNIYLLDQTKHELSQSFVCLIKFKVLYKQETMNEPILLSLSLFCHKNNFCMKVKNVNQENIDISKISANWQWEIIKVFKGDVVNKLLQNAQKVNQETYEYAKTFLFLLKSINYKKI